MDKELIKALELLDEGNPFASFLDKSTLSRVDNWIDTGSYVLNAIMSGKLKEGGVPSGRVTMLYGESQTGKSLFVQKILANAQKTYTNILQRIIQPKIDEVTSLIN